jgi:DNA-directed RNA polymerase specialized sigma24 family protein
MKNKICSTNLPRTVTQAELAQLAQQGHLGAFAALFDLHKGTVYSLCLQTTSSVPVAEQLTEDIFLCVFRNLRACPEGVDFSAWVHNAAVSRLKMHERTMHLSAPFLDHLVVLAAKPVGSHRKPERFARMRTRIREARATLANHGSWGSIWARFARPHQAGESAFVG